MGRTSGSGSFSTRVGVASLCLVQFLDVMGVTVVVTALPVMLADLHASPAQGGLIATGYAMCFGGLLMLGARLGDRYGHRRMILASLAVFAVASLTAAIASTLVLLTAARCLQGAAAAVSVPSALRLITTITEPGPERHRSLAWWSAAGAAAGITGFVVGGIVTQTLGWQAIFWAYLPLSGVLGLLVARTVPRDRDADTSVPLNLAGSALCTAAVMAVVVGAALVGQRGQAWVGAALLAGGLVVAVLFVAVDRRAKAPLLPAVVLRVAALRQGSLGAMLNTFTTSSAITLVTLYLQEVRGRSPVGAAVALVPFSVAVIVGSVMAGRVLRVLRPQRVVALGLGLIAAADLLLIWAAPSAVALPVCVAVAGAGIGLSSVASTALGTDVDPAWRGTASAVLNTAAQLGTALGIAALVLVADLTTGLPRPGASVPSVAWALAATIAASGAVAFSRALSGRRA
jgi:MFS family permease